MRIQVWTDEAWLRENGLESEKAQLEQQDEAMQEDA